MKSIKINAAGSDYRQLQVFNKEDLLSLNPEVIAIEENTIDYKELFIKETKNYIYTKANEQLEVKSPVFIRDVVDEAMCLFEEKDSIEKFNTTYTINSEYIVLPQSLRGIYFTEDNKPDYNLCYEEIYKVCKKYIESQIKSFNSEIQRQEKLEKDRENKKQDIIVKAKEKYNSTSDVKERNKIITDLKDTLELDFGEKLTKNKIILLYLSDND